MSHSLFGCPLIDYGDSSHTFSSKEADPLASKTPPSREEGEARPWDPERARHLVRNALSNDMWISSRGITKFVEALKPGVLVNSKTIWPDRRNTFIGREEATYWLELVGAQEFWDAAEVRDDTFVSKYRISIDVERMAASLGERVNLERLYAMETKSYKEQSRALVTMMVSVFVPYLELLRFLVEIEALHLVAFMGPPPVEDREVARELFTAPFIARVKARESMTSLVGYDAVRFIPSREAVTALVDA